jgi:hypothetical protein
MEALLRLAVWAKAPDHPTIPGAKIDAYGYAMKFGEYGNAGSSFGWEIDHHPVPKALGGSDDLTNLRPLNCGQNRRNGAQLGAAMTNPFRRGMFGFGR